MRAPSRIPFRPALRHAARFALFAALGLVAGCQPVAQEPAARGLASVSSTSPQSDRNPETNTVGPSNDSDAVLAPPESASVEQPDSAARAASRPPPAELLVVLIGGMDSDPTPEQMAGTAPRRQGNSGLFQLQGDIRRDGIACEYFNWNGTRAGFIHQPDPPQAQAIVRCIRDRLDGQRGGRVCIVGNSWGGHTALVVCEELASGPAPVAVEDLVLLDPSSALRADRPRPSRLPVNVNRAVNFVTRNVFTWGVWRDEPRVRNVDLGDKSLGYMRGGKPAYDAAFDFSAHVAAEWDERIHREIAERILGLLPPRE